MEENLEEDSLNVVDTLSNFKFYQRSIKPSDDAENKQPQASDNPEFVLSIEHSQYTDIDAVGLQVWSGALLLSDYIIDEGNSVFGDANIIELSSGTGFVSIIASIFCKRVMCTDLDEENVLKTIQKNFESNKPLVKATYSIRELNFFKPWAADVANFVKDAGIVLVSESKFSCQYIDCEETKGVDMTLPREFIYARIAEINGDDFFFKLLVDPDNLPISPKSIFLKTFIYDNEITDGFIATLHKIFDLQPSVKIYMTVEKRFVFTLANLKVEAVHYDYFFHKINGLRLTWNFQKLDTNFPRYFFEYDRSKELELWRISLD